MDEPQRSSPAKPITKSASATTFEDSHLLPSWMRQPLDHFSARSSLEDFGTSPPDHESLFLHKSEETDNFPVTEREGKSILGRGRGLPRRPYSDVGERCNKIIVTGAAAHDFESHPRADPDQFCRPPSRPRSPNPFFINKGADSGTESAHTTPSVTPQHSPQLMRRVLDANISAARPQVGLGNDVGSVRKPLAAQRRRLQVTNFDLNAVSPTSW